MCNQRLVDIENEKRSSPNRNSLCTIVFTEKDDLRCLKDQGYTLSDIPPKGESLHLKYVANLSQGGMSERIDANTVHSSYWSMFQKIWNYFPELPILSLDVLSWDISLPATVENMVVCEAHVSPGLGMFLAPGKGDGVDLYTSFVQIIFPELTSSCE